MRPAFKLDGEERTRTVAMMAATLEAGDRAAMHGATFDGGEHTETRYVARALDLLDEVEQWLKARPRHEADDG